MNEEIRYIKGKSLYNPVIVLIYVIRGNGLSLSFIKNNLTVLLKCVVVPTLFPQADKEFHAFMAEY